MKKRLFVRYWPSPSLMPTMAARMVKLNVGARKALDKPVVEWLLYAGSELVSGPNKRVLDRFKDSLPENLDLSTVEVILLLPGESLTITHITPPSKQSRHIHRAVGYMLEEQLSEDPELLHFAIADAKQVDRLKAQYTKAQPSMQWPPESGQVPVVVVAKALMQKAIDDLNELGVNPTIAVPDLLLLPFTRPTPLSGSSEAGESHHPFFDESEEGGYRWSGMLESGRFLLRTGIVAGQSMLQSQTALLVMASQEAFKAAETTADSEAANSNLGGGLNQPIHLSMHFQSSDAKSQERVSQLVKKNRQAGGELPVLSTAQPQEGSPLILICYHYLEMGAPINLFQGDFKQKARRSSSSRFRWQPAAAVAAIWCLLQVGLYVSEAAWYSSEAERLDQVSRDLFKEINPDVKRIVNVKSQLMAQLKQADQATGETFLHLLERVGDPIAKINGPSSSHSSKPPQVELKRVSFDRAQGLLRMDLFVAGYPVLDKLKGSMEQQGLSVGIDGASKDKDRVKVKLKVKV